MVLGGEGLDRLAGTDDDRDCRSRDDQRRYSGPLDDGGDLDRIQAVKRHRGRARLRRRPGHTEPERDCGRQDPYVTENPMGVPADNLSLRACGVPRARKSSLRTGKPVRRSRRDRSKLPVQKSKRLTRQTRRGS